MYDITRIYCIIDDFYKVYESNQQKKLNITNKGSRGFGCKLSMSEIICIVIMFHKSDFRTFKHYYLNLEMHYKSLFPDLVSYNRFIQLLPRTFVPLCCFSQSLLEESTGINYIDSTPIKVCRNKRIFNHKVFEGIAKKGKSTMGWFYGFKLHLVINETGGVIDFQISPGNVDDRKPVEHLSRNLKGKLFADKGYISKKLCSTLAEQGLQLITGLKKNMKERLMPLIDKLYLRKRSIIETINDQLKNISQLEHSRHRSANSFMINALASIVSYILSPKKPSIKFTAYEQKYLGSAMVPQN